MRARAVELIRSGWRPTCRHAAIAGVLLGVAAGLVLADLPASIAAAFIAAAGFALTPLR